MSGPVRWLYVVTKPDDARGVCQTWEECREKVRGRRGTCYMKVYDRDEADAILSGRGVVLAPGRYAFTDANALGGIGVIIVRGIEGGGEPQIEKEIPTSVNAVFHNDGIEGLRTADEINSAVTKGRNPFAEMGALYVALRELEAGTEATIVHDYLGVAAFMPEGGWTARKAHMKPVVRACWALAEAKQLQLTYVHQPGHRSSRCGRHDLARFNACADLLATKGGGGQVARF